MENRPTAVEWLTEQLDNYFSQAQKEQTLEEERLLLISLRFI